MKKLTAFFLKVFAGFFLITARVFAVWVPSTSLENVGTQQSPTNADATKMTVPERFHSVVQKLEDDEHRLAILLSNLEKDEEALMNRSKRTGSGEEHK